MNIPEKQILGISHRENTQKNFLQEQLLAMHVESSTLPHVTLQMLKINIRKKNAASNIDIEIPAGGQIDNRTDTEENASVRLV
ncbi:hypothetical protein [Klebsiella pneumoniae]|uniref:hypothetical protein n=1 Tax=Klebsiella pneumoniae TaxID=573 RepID=UPI0022B6A227|nr:hypothetical protein [Klebsiella pneumoniae]